MESSEIFDDLLQNLKVGDSSIVIASRRDEITKALTRISDPRRARLSTG